MIFSHPLPSLFFLAFLSTGVFLCGLPESGWAQDADADGILDATEASIGSNRLRKDVFVQCNYMQIDFNADGDGLDRGEHSHRMSTTTVQQLTQIFSSAPVFNPGLGCQGGPQNGRACSSNATCGGFPCSHTGITLHIEQTPLKFPQPPPQLEQRFLDFTSRKGGPNFFDLKAINFNFATRSSYYRYCILAHDAGEEMGSASGQAEILGNDFMLTLGAWPNETGLPVGKATDQIGTFLHEIGHTFGLEHGGGGLLPAEARIENYKPNYVSGMNYFFQVLGIRSNTGIRFDFSRAALPTLNENALNEGVGIQDGADFTRFFCPDFSMRTKVGSGAIDWNCSGAMTAGVVANPNGDRTFQALPLRNTLEGYNDWANLKFSFTTSPLYDAGASVGFGQHRADLGEYKPVSMTVGHGIDREPEATLPGGRCQEFLSISQVPVTQGVTFRTRLFPQVDTDRNGVGDTCER